MRLLRNIRRRLSGLDSDRGASAVELAILAPALILVSMMIVQYAVWLDASHAALAAAQEGDRAARELEFGNTTGNVNSAVSQVATSYYQGLNTRVLSNLKVTTSGPDAANNVSVTVSGTLNGIFPPTLTVSETVTGPVECLRASADQGVHCAAPAAG